MNFILKKFNELSVDELYDVLHLRQQIFVVEQQCIYLDADGIDKQCLHLLFFIRSELAGYARIIPPGVLYKTPSIGRVVIDRKYRGNKYAYRMMEKAMALTQAAFKAKKISISAQLYLQEFYEKLGFKKSGEVYLDCDLPHLKMIADYKPVKSVS